MPNPSAFIDRKFVTGGEKIQQKKIVCQEENCPVSCGLLCEGLNEEKAMTMDMGSYHGWGPKEKPERGILGKRVSEEEA